MTTPVEKAKAKFDNYAGMDAPDVPSGLLDMSSLQVQLYRWQIKNFPSSGRMENFQGMVEELGELSHALLKHKQRIRGMGTDDVLREKAGDAVADLIIFAIQFATTMRLDVGVLLGETALEVMKRDWAEHPDDAHVHAG